jgi:hypothetical protein
MLIKGKRNCLGLAHRISSARGHPPHPTVFSHHDQALAPQHSAPEADRDALTQHRGRRLHRAAAGKRRPPEPRRPTCLTLIYPALRQDIFLPATLLQHHSHRHLTLLPHALLYLAAQRAAASGCRTPSAASKAPPPPLPPAQVGSITSSKQRRRGESQRYVLLPPRPPRSSPSLGHSGCSRVHL